MKSARVAFGVVLAAGACASQAYSIDLVSDGTYAYGTSPFFSTTESVILDNASQAGLPVLTSTYFEIPNSTSLPEPADGYYTNGTDAIDYTAALTSLTSNGDGSIEAATGSWTYSGGTGAYAGLMGSGLFSILVDSGTNNSAYITFSGELSPVPEPATILPIAAGVIGLALRKRFA